MSRIHFFEFEDLPWFPSILREFMTDHLSFMAEQAKGPYGSVRHLQLARSTG
jgi:hypothetical protein